ncbi:unnamed protein product, partial [marine sediment metagenome]
LTKVDKLSKNEVNRQIDLISNQLLKESFDQPILFSAKTGQGRKELWKKINEIV